MVDATTIHTQRATAAAAGVMAQTFQPHQYDTLEEELLGQHLLADLGAAMGASALVAPFVRYVGCL